MHTFRKHLELDQRSCRSCSAKSTEREIKRCQALKPEMRTGMKTKVVFNTFVWYLCDVWLVSKRCHVLSYTTCLETLFVQNRICVLCHCEEMMTPSAMQISKLFSCSTSQAVLNLAEVKMCSCNHWAQGGQLTPPYASIDWYRKGRCYVFDLVFRAFGNWLSTL